MSKTQNPARYLIYCNACRKQAIGSKDHCESCPHCYAPKPLWRKLSPREHLTLQADMVIT